ncbi:radical SAM protein [Bradyrhizobium sp. CCGUVB23]|uniref:radical SAM protein n=1 Tax=Bradyrhizobium sp. CCGUVB23 TaxID=2949630 RepID=UPI0020B2A026|nr:radical SAM protein [Bradyrhizobium sp. CCGUVB23]MCP3468012.1 radical SAM protein [Bradyrhizobium sp. CCGUVB23]
MSGQSEILSAIDPRVFELFLLPTEKCNFRCTYCYENFSIGKMKKPVIDGIKALLTRKAQRIELLKVSWFGGEPLLAPEIIEEISHHITSLTRISTNFQYCGSMTTNGYLLEPLVLRRLVDIGITGFQISLDGDEDAHNSRRKMLNGCNSFGQIWQNLMSIRESECNVDVLLRIHLTPDNLVSAEMLLEKILSEFGNDRRFTVFLKPIAKLGGVNDSSTAVIADKNQSEVVRQLGRMVAKHMHVLNCSRKLEDRICSASKLNSLVVRADGSLAKCTIALYDARNNIGQIRQDGTLHLRREHLLPWLQGLQSLDAGHLACPYRALAMS